MQRRVLIAGFAVGCLAIACGDDDDSPSNGGSDGGSNGGSSSGEFCMPSGEADYGECTEAEVKEYSDCIQDACADKYEECFGAGYLKGNFGGPCEEYMDCAAACDCGDTACTEKCSPSSECTSCMTGFASCGQSCFSKLSCATGALGDAGITLDKTCDDLKDCCASLTGSSKSSCDQTYQAISGQGDLYCSATISTFCPN